MASNSPHIDPSTSSSRLGGEETRKLAAIMFTDIKDFSRKMQKDEAATMRMLKIHNQILDETVKKNGGTLVKTIGDAYLVSFDSVVNATLCAIEAQQMFHQHNSKANLPDQKIEVRIGVHLGDVIVKDRDVFGDGVNIASRIQSIAGVGGVNISDSVYQQVRNKINIRVLNLGVPQLKGIDQPVKVYQVIIIPTDKSRGKLATELLVLRTILKRTRTRRMLAWTILSIAVIVLGSIYFLSPAPTNSIAVLPFEYIGEPASEYIADGITDELIERLSKLPKVLVISRSGSFFYKGKNIPEKDIAKELGVRYLIKGRMKVFGDEVSVEPRLLEPAKGIMVWSAPYDVLKTDIMRLQDEIPRQVALHMKVEFAPEQQKGSFEAYDLYQRGIFELRKRKKENNPVAIAYFNQAIEKDPQFPRGYYGLAMSELYNYELGWDRKEQWLDQAEQHCQKALSLDSTLAEAYGVFGRLAIDRGDLNKGVSLLEHAIQLNPNDKTSLIALGIQYNQNLNDPTKAISLFLRAQQVDPTDFYGSFNVGYGYYMLRNYPEAIKLFRQSLALSPSFEQTWINLAATYEKISEYDSASEAMKTILQIDPTNSDIRANLSDLYLTLGKPAQAESTVNVGIKLDPLNYKLWYTLGHIQQHSYNGKEAISTWQRGLQLVENDAAQNPHSAEPKLYAAMFKARLGYVDEAISLSKQAVALDSTSDIVVGVARIYAILNDKEQTLEWFRRAKSMSSDFDEAFLKTDIDFENVQGDPELLSIARR